MFTGSTDVGMKVMAGAASQVKRVTLELGGKSANIIFDDCDLGALRQPHHTVCSTTPARDCCARSRHSCAAQCLPTASWSCLSQPCAAVVGDPTARDTEMGPLVSRAFRFGSRLCARRCAGRVSGSAAGPGYWFPPTVLLPVGTTAQSPKRFFGPVVTVLPFDDEADAIALANDTEYGLSPVRSGRTTCHERCVSRVPSRRETSA